MKKINLLTKMQMKNILGGYSTYPGCEDAGIDNFICCTDAHSIMLGMMECNEAVTLCLFHHGGVGLTKASNPFCPQSTDQA